MMHVGLARQQRVDHVVAEPVAEIAGVAVGNHRDAAGRDRRSRSVGVSRISTCTLVDRRRAFDAEAVAVEQQREIVEAEMIDEAERGAVAACWPDRWRNS